MSIGSLISAGLSFIGGRRAAKSQQRANEINDLRQREFATQGIQWRVKDANKAGIHPLYALSANTPTYSPSTVGTGDGGISAAGQDLGRAVSSMYGGTARENREFVRAHQRLQLRKMGLENELLASKIATIRQPGTAPQTAHVGGSLIDGQPQSGLVDTRPMRRESAHKRHPSTEAGTVTDTGLLRTQTGWAPVMSHDAKDRLEEDWPGNLGWQIRNRLVQMFGYNYHPALPKGRTFYYNPYMAEYQEYTPRTMRSGRKRPWSYMRK